MTTPAKKPRQAKPSSSQRDDQLSSSFDKFDARQTESSSSALAFDPESHRFGMAYYLMLRDGSIFQTIDGSDAIVYVLDHGKTDCNYAWPDGSLHRTELRWLARAPEHDLIRLAEITADPSKYGFIPRSQYDNPETDGTDAAHPAYWRGQDSVIQHYKDSVPRKDVDALVEALSLCTDILAEKSPNGIAYKNGVKTLSEFRKTYGGRDE